MNIPVKTDAWPPRRTASGRERSVRMVGRLPGPPGRPALVELTAPTRKTASTFKEPFEDAEVPTASKPKTSPIADDISPRGGHLQ